MSIQNKFISGKTFHAAKLTLNILIHTTSAWMYFTYEARAKEK